MKLTRHDMARAKAQRPGFTFNGGYLTGSCFRCGSFTSTQVGTLPKAQGKARDTILRATEKTLEWFGWSGCECPKHAFETARTFE